MIAMAQYIDKVCPKTFFVLGIPRHHVENRFVLMRTFLRTGENKNRNRVVMASQVMVIGDLCIQTDVIFIASTSEIDFF